MVHFLILAGGDGKRAKNYYEKIPKQFIEFNNISPLKYLLSKIDKIKEVSSITVVIKRNNIKEYKKASKDTKKLRKYVFGGNSRKESCIKGISNLQKEFGNKRNQKVLIHDAARPFVSKEIIIESINKLKKYDATCPFIKIEDTIKSIDCKKNINHLDRDKVISLQTPQGFDLNQIFELHKKSIKLYDDDLSIIIDEKKSFKLIKGSKENFKITTYEDLTIFKNIITGKKKKFFGIGFDIHPFVEGNEINLGGLKFKSKYKIDAHSDGDVLLHSITDAIFGALGKDDIGIHFSPNILKYKNKESTFFLNKALNYINKYNGEIINLDINLICDYPKIKPIKLKIEKNLSNLLNLETSKINIKATTTEDQGFINFKNGIAAQSIISIEVLNE